MDGSVQVIPGGARRGVSEASAELAQDPLLILGSLHRVEHGGLARGPMPSNPGADAPTAEHRAARV